MSTYRRASLPVHHLTLGQTVVEYSLQRSARRRTIGLRIDDQGLRVSVPPWASDTDIEQALQEHARWILDKLRKWERRAASTPPLALEPGTELLWLGHSLPLQQVSAREAIPRPVHPDQALDFIPLSEDCEDALSAVTAWYVAQALPWFRRRALVYGERLGRLPREVRLSNARGRWGSCTRQGVIRLNWRLMQASPEEIDYVVAHEVAHLAEMNHSPAFWNTVSRLYPGWQAASDLLDARDRLYRRF